MIVYILANIWKYWHKTKAALQYNCDHMTYGVPIKLFYLCVAIPWESNSSEQRNKNLNITPKSGFSLQFNLLIKKINIPNYYLQATSLFKY